MFSPRKPRLKKTNVIGRERGHMAVISILRWLRQEDNYLINNLIRSDWTMEVEGDNLGKGRGAWLAKRPERVVWSSGCGRGLLCLRMR